jgi:hypothetical protein
MENPWNGEITYHVATEITKQVLWVKKLLAIISKQYYHPNSLSDQIRSEHNIIIPYIHFNAATTLVDSTLIILIFQKRWKFSKKTYFFQVLRKICEGKRLNLWEYFICQNENFKILINYLTDMCWSCQAKVLLSCHQIWWLQIWCSRFQALFFARMGIVVG